MGKLTEEVFNESCCDGGSMCDSERTIADKHADELVKAGVINVPERKMGWSPASASHVGDGIIAAVMGPVPRVKDSGERIQFESGMVRDITEGKVDYTLVLDGPMFHRWAAHLTAGAQKYSKRNWMLASGDGEYERFRESAFRHFLQWFRGDTDEDHAAAVMFNINGAEYVKGKK